MLSIWSLKVGLSNRRAIIAINDGGYKTGDSDQERKASEMKKVKESLKSMRMMNQ